MFLLLGSGCAYTIQGTPVAGPLPEVPTVECTYVDTSEEANNKAVEPPSGKDVPSGGEVVMRLDTALGDLEFTLDAASAPCSVHSFRHLVEKRLYDGNACHRLVTEGIWIVQCGDPTTSGLGGPGYRYDDPEARTGGYERGVIGMANRATAGTNGSQFFIVYKDSEFPPDYPIIGKVTKGLDIIDQVATAGVTPVTSKTDGKPVKQLKFKKVQER
ncbi:hypothetical protein BN6_25060 [Saccharothrix espanaensis DSM 44229]|uniref:PPIase cyclophilin-type domain-containing protein n=1 Tax=Saccharothrix espanaensis (strain ATCC 51144 / DSM 44229 / JCM 9112 / NBRC 15066 / NRRL 15764) TaxID=1179773 RepID=K0JQR8_SACES|nr:hypothetical protein BN6_25060 [Saccharothrix espanaensis DSM 44229]